MLSATPLSASTNWSAANPANTVSVNSVDPNLKNDTTDEFIVGLDREVGRGFAVGANYIYRKYGNFQWNDRVNFTSADWATVSFTPTTGCQGADGLRTEASRWRADVEQSALVDRSDRLVVPREYSGQVA